MAIRHQQVIAILLAALLLASCRANPSGKKSPNLEPVTLKLNWEHSAQFLGFYIAEEKGFYTKEGLAITIEPKLEGDQNIPEKLAAGEYDFTCGGDIQRAQIEGVPITVIASIYQFGPDAFFARADSGILTPADFAGHTVVVKSPGWQRLLEELLAKNGLTLKDITPINGGFDMTSFFNGEVDVWSGFLTNEVILARQQGTELVTFPLYEYGMTTSALVIAVSQETLDKNPDRASRFLRASLQGWQWAIENPQQAVEILVRNFPELAADAEFQQASFDASIPLISPPGVQIGAIDCNRWITGLHLEEDEQNNSFLCTTHILEAARQGK